MAEFWNCSQGCDSLSLTSAPRIMLQVKLLYFIAFLLSFNCLIIGFHNNRGPWKVGWSNPHWWINCSKVANNKASCLGRSFWTDGHYLGKIAPELRLMREAKVPYLIWTIWKYAKEFPGPGRQKKGCAGELHSGAVENSNAESRNVVLCFVFSVVRCTLLVILTMSNLLLSHCMSLFCIDLELTQTPTLEY